MNIDWTKHIWFTNERQKLNGFETDGCEFFSAQQSFDAQMDVLLASAPQTVIDRLTSMGFMDMGTDGTPHFHSSARFMEVMSGVGTKGASSTQVYNTIEKYGILPWTDLPFDATITPAEYFAAVPQILQVKALQFVELLGGKNAIKYNWIIDNGTKDIGKIAAALPSAPVCLGIAVTAFWNQPIPGDPIPGDPPAHEVMCYDIQGNNLLILDHYEPPLKTLDIGYPVHFASQIIVLPVWQVQQEVQKIETAAQIIIPQVPPAQASLIQQAISWLKQAFLKWANGEPLTGISKAELIGNEIETSMSTSFSISQAEIMSVLKGFLIAEGGALLVTASTWLGTGTFDLHALLVLEGAAIASTAINFVRKYFPNTTQS